MQLPLRLKVSKEQHTYNWKIDCPTPKDFTLKISLTADAKLLKKIWRFRKNILLRKKGIDTKDNKLEDVKNFLVPPEYHNFMKTATKTVVNNCAKNFEKDGIVLLSWEVVKAIYVLNIKSGWDIEIFYEGIYTDKRT